MWDYFLYKLKEKLRLEDDDDRTDKVIENSAMWAMSAALIPIPLADMIAVTVIQTDMVRRLAEIHGVSAENANIESWLGTLSGGVLSKLGAQALKLIPGWGSIAGGVGMALLSGASTYAAGKTFAKHFREGGTLENFDANAVKEFYDEQFVKGRDFAKKMKDEVEKRAKAAYAEFSGEEVKEENKKDFNFEEVIDFEEEIHTAEAPKQANPSAAHASKAKQAPRTEEPVPSPSNTTTTEHHTENLLNELRQLASLRDKGILTEEEFQRLKSKLMQQL